MLLVSASAGVGVAQSGNPAWADDLYDQMSSMVEPYNDNVADANLGVAGDQLADRRVNVYITSGDETAVFSFYMDADNRITDLQPEAHPDAQLKMTTSKATLESLAASDNPAADFRSAVANDDIVIAGEDGHIVEQVKWTVINVVKGFVL
ncbi:MAG: hypothetical protein ACQETI_02450 [Halobacteriota archaeon]